MTTHRINRAEIEIHAGEVALAEHLIERLSLLRERRIAPLIDRVCSELSGHERLDRIDRLDIDLGALAIDDFDDDFLRKLEAALRAALARQLATARGAEPPGQASFELLEAFARTGNVPWWADRSEPELVAGHVRALLAAAPRELLRLVRALAQDALALVRLARHCDDALLEAIVERTHPGSRAELLAGIHELERVLGLAGSENVPSRALAVRARSAVLTVLARSDTSEAETMLRALVHELASSWPQTLALLASRDTRLAAPSWLRDAVQDAGVPLLSGDDTTEVERDIMPGAAPQEQPGIGHEPASARSSAGLDALGYEQAHFDSSSGHDGLLRREHEPARGQSGGSRGADALDRLPGDGPVSGASRELATRRLAARTASEGEPVWREYSSREDGRAIHERPREIPSIQAARRRALAELEQLYVDDAGLVILWPFLDRFFARVGLLDERHCFLDEHATMQAVALLEQLAIEESERPEFCLPLAKVLCGLPPEAGFALEHPLAPDQLEECERLLTAVIDHASILREMPVASFRATFLERPGALSTRDGAWLLQVERRAHDLVLDRFPWSWSWIKLPWMPHPLRVEW